MPPMGFARRGSFNRCAACTKGGIRVRQTSTASDTTRLRVDSCESQKSTNVFSLNRKITLQENTAGRLKAGDPRKKPTKCLIVPSGAQAMGTCTHTGVQAEVLLNESASPSNQTMLWMFMGPRNATETASSNGASFPLTETSCGFRCSRHEV